MTLDELYNAVYGDEIFIREKLDVAAKVFRKSAIKQRSVPFKGKYSYKNYKSNIIYTIYLIAFTRSQWSNPQLAITTSYTHDEGTTMLMIDLLNNKEMALIDTHFWSRFRERYLKDKSLSTQETIDFFMYNYNTMSIVDGVMHVDEEKADENTEYFASVSPLGVFYCEKLNENKKVTVFRTYLPMEMLRKEQYRNVAIRYLCTYFKDYMNFYPKEANKIDAIMESFMSKADNENWSMDKFITESEKLMDEYPLYVI